MPSNTAAADTAARAQGLTVDISIELTTATSVLRAATPDTLKSLAPRDRRHTNQPPAAIAFSSFIASPMN